MGYRSDVAYVIKFDDIQTRDAYVTLMLAHDDPLVRQAIEECDYDNARDPIITFEQDDVKWYPSYRDVMAHRFIYSNAFELEMGSYRCVTLGEDGAEDCETECIHDGHDLYDYISTRHTLETNF
jgi:hypothetical protein